MLEYFSSFFSSLSTFVSPTTPPPVETDVIIKALQAKLAADRIKTPTCVLRLDSNFSAKEYYIDLSCSLDTMISYISNALNSSKESWRIRTWDDTWTHLPDVGYIIEINELRTLATKKCWFFNLTPHQQQHLNAIYRLFS